MSHARKSHPHAWGYSDLDGPHKWADMFGAGKHQSPINIQLGQRAQQLSTCCAGQLLQSQQARQHLDSQGEDSHKRSSSVNSCASSNSSDEPNFDSDFASASPSPAAEPANHSTRCTKHGEQNTRFVATKRKLFLGYPRFLHSMQLCNTGHGWQVSLDEHLAEHTRKLPVAH